MTNQLASILTKIEAAYGGKIKKGARHYLEVNLAEQARKLGYTGFSEEFKNACAIVPLKDPQKGMKVRIDGRTFVDYAQYDSGISVPGYIAKAAGRAYPPFVPNDSMICNFC